MLQPISLTYLIKDLPILKILNQNDHSDIQSIEFDSRKSKSQTIFVAIKGTQADGHDYIDKVIEQGCKIIVCVNLPQALHLNVTYIQVANSAKSLGAIASAYYDHPSRHIHMIGVTGTNGKTSTTTMLYQLLTSLGYKCGLISTIQIQIGDEIIPATHTTPDAVSLQSHIRQMVDQGCTYCFMEVSSHAIDQERIAGIRFRGAVFTNITHDHLDYHLTFANYIQAKKKFFDDLDSNAFALTNIDDKNGKVMLQNTSASKKTYAMHHLADYVVKIQEMSLAYMLLQIQRQEIMVQVIGEFNAYNVLATYAVATELGFESGEILRHLSKLKPVEGRIDVVVSNNQKIQGIVDYAHTPDAVEKVLTEVRKMNTKGQILTVIGCGGDRDKAKRPIMAKLACQHSDRVILTADNPRSEDPKQIIQDMKSDLTNDDQKKTLTIIDRREAIKSACMLASQEDSIVLVGKGHEKYQEINGEKFPFDDKAELIKFFEELGL